MVPIVRITIGRRTLSEHVDPFYLSRAWMDLRYRVLKRHAGGCQLCGVRGTAENPLQVDHIKPRSQFPALALDERNMQVLCRACNLGKGARDWTDWRWAQSQQLSVLETAEPAKRAKLQQLGWLKLNGDKQMKAAATKEYRKLWREVEEAWFARGKP